MYKRRLSYNYESRGLKTVAPCDALVGCKATLSPVSNFTREVVGNGTKNPTVYLRSDIYMLFNQQRLDKMTQQALLQHFDTIAQSNSSFSALRSKMSDDQLISFVKSRYIQTPSELLSWSNYLLHEYNVSISDLEKQGAATSSVSDPPAQVTE